MLSLLNFEDDSLPKVRRAIMTTSSILIFVSIFNLKFNINALDFVSLPDNQSDPKLILVLLVLYLLVRIISVGNWFIPLAKIETANENEKLNSLSAALKRLEAQKPDLVKVLAAAEKLPWQHADTADRAVSFSESLMKLQEVVDGASRTLTLRLEGLNLLHNSDNQVEDTLVSSKKLGELLSDLRTTVKECLNEIQREVPGEHLADLRMFFDDSRSHKRGILALQAELSAEISQKNLYQVFRALRDLDGDRIRAGNAKNSDAVIFGLYIPGSWAILALTTAGWRWGHAAGWWSGQSRLASCFCQAIENTA